MSESTREDRTEPASPRRLEKAREEGRIPVSRELAGAAGLTGAALAMHYVGGDAARDLGLRLSVFLTHLDQPALAGADGINLAGMAMLRGVAPFMLAAMVAGALGVLGQTGFLLRPSALTPDPSRLDPRAGLRRLFGAETAVEALKSVIRLGAMSGAVWSVLHGLLPGLGAAAFKDPRALLPAAAEACASVLLAVLGVQAVLALLDIAWVRYRFARDMRMSRQELLDEQREADGDPRIKARIRQIRLQRARRRMLAAVPKATVVITNPTHYAVALAYDRAKSAAPRVVAKGVDSMAARIRETAEAHRIPLVANPPLARVLHLVELDAEIPAQHFQAVAEIIAYVWRLNSGPRR